MARQGWSAVQGAEAGGASARVVLAVRRRALGEALTLALEQAPGVRVQGVARSMSEAVAVVRRCSPDAVVLDLFETDADERTSARTLRQVDPDVHVIVLHHGARAPRGQPDGTTYVSSQTGLDGLLDIVRSRTQARSPRQEGPSTGVLTGPALSPSEQRVAALVAEGYPNRRIAEELHLSERTVRNYVSNILRKLRLDNRTQLAVVVREDGTGARTDGP